MRLRRFPHLISGTVLIRAYGWDVADNLTAIANLIDSARSQSFGYDGLYRLTFAQGIYGSHSYQYDALGNRTALTTDTASTSYAYATTSNRLIEVDEGTGAVPIAYDPAGNTLDDGARSFTYNARNRLSEADGHQYGHNAHNLRVYKPRFGIAGDASGDGQITEADLTLLQQALNGQGTATLAMDCNQDGVVDQRDTACIARQIGSNRNQGQANGGGQGNGGGGSGPPAPAPEPAQVGWVLFTHDEQGRLIGEYDEQGNPLRRYIWLNDTPVALIDAEGVHHIHTDHLNTPQVVTDSNGTIVWAADYAPFGEVTETVATLEMNLRFPGQYLDRETGLHQNWHREYDPMTGRYTQSDPIGLGGDLNTFVYVGGNPIFWSDPSGLEVLLCHRQAEILRGMENHYWIRTGDIEAGMGGAPGIRPGDEYEYLFITRVYVRDHSEDQAEECTPIRDVDEDCVNKHLQLGLYLGRFTPWNNCRTFVRQVVRECSTKQRIPRPIVFRRSEIY